MASHNPHITLTCANPACQRDFHPWRGREATQRYCSESCGYQDAQAPDRKYHRAQWRQESRQCKRCHQQFTPKRAVQRFCSPLCAHGHGLDAIRPGSSHHEAANEKRREAMLRVRQRTAAVRGLPSSEPPLPPTEPEESPERPEPGEQDTNHPPLYLPLEGEAARREWYQVGALRQAQADKKLRWEELHTTEGRTVVLSGMGSYLGVEGMSLVCHQGRTHGSPAPARELLYPALHGVKRIIWIGGVGYQGGTLTLPAVQWCRREQISLVVLDGSGEPLLATVPDYPHDPELRRRQWLVSSGVAGPWDSGKKHPLAARIVRELLRAKFTGQHQTLASHPDLPQQQRYLPELATWRDWLDLPDPPAWQFNIEHMRRAEGRLALAYFRAWEGWPLKWVKPDLKRIPPPWLTARSRISPLSPIRSGRHALDPVNACLNYGYGCLASQCRQSLLAEGFDLAAGFLHSDKPGRDSATYDLMECERGAVDALVLDFLARTPLHYGDFARAPDGSLTLHPQLARLLIASCRVPQSRIDRHAKWLRHFLLTGSERETTPADAPEQVNG